MIYTELIRNLDDDLLLELHENLIEILQSEINTSDYIKFIII